MPTPRPLLMIGNKRSGTSLMVELLNQHPHIFITHEADSIWVLHQMMDGWPETFRRYPWDGPLGMQATLQACRRILRAAARDRRFDPAVVFRRTQIRRMPNRLTPSHWLRRRRLRWLGDKKPVQHCDPRIRDFLERHFTEARYLHIVRHPWAVAASMQSAAASWSEGVPPYWREGPQGLLERWAIHEGWALDLRESGLPVHTLRFEQLAQDPIAEMGAVFDFLDLEPPPRAAQRWISKHVRSDPNLKYRDERYDASPEVQRIMSLYGYEADPLKMTEAQAPFICKARQAC